MRSILSRGVAVAAVVLAAPALAQTSYPSAAPGVRVGGTVTLACNAAGAACQPVSPASPLTTRGVGAGAVATAQVSAGTTATLVAPARAGRMRVMVTVTAATGCAFGPAGVTSATGFPLQPVAGATLTLDTAADLYAVCSATTTIGVLEQF